VICQAVSSAYSIFKVKHSKPMVVLSLENAHNTVKIHQQRFLTLFNMYGKEGLGVEV
jgi:hypothetical protein